MKVNQFQWLGIVTTLIIFTACTPELNTTKAVNKYVPKSFNHLQDTTNIATIRWKNYFTDPYLIALIDTALINNQELNITIQEIVIAQNEVMEKKGEYLPFVTGGADVGMDKVGRFTRFGALEANNEIEPGREFPEPFSDFMIGAYASWEIDIWRKLRNAKKSAYMKYLATEQGRNFMVTNLIAEIAQSYYELLALDNQLDIVNQNIRIQSNALQIVKLQKQAARITELAVRRFEAQVLNTRSLQFEIRQMIIEVENKINFLLGRFPQPIPRDFQVFTSLSTDSIQVGIPAQLLINRPDVRQAEMELEASKLDVKVARARFYPSLDISASLGYQAFNPAFLVRTPESLLYTLAGGLTAPLINRKSIKASYLSANARQIQAVYHYEQTLLNAYFEVANLLSRVGNLQSSYELRVQQVEALNASVNISNDLFRSARADYMEVLLTQRDALESRFEMIETKQKQLNAKVNIYRALGGGWD